MAKKSAPTLSQTSVNIPLLSIFLINGLLWLNSAYGKFASGNFPQTLDKTLARFIDKNPNAWMVDMLNNIAIPNAQVMGVLIMWAELIAALLLICCSAYLLATRKMVWHIKYGFIKAFAITIVLNTLFYFAAGHTSPSTSSLNLLMLGIGIVGLVTFLKK